MTNKLRAFIFLLSLALYFFAASYQDSPGYMDADYQLYMGQRLANNLGFSEDILWNYLDDPSELPHPSHSYWSPLPSMLAAIGIRLFPSLDSFQAARVPFIVLAAFLPLLTSEIAFMISDNRRIAVWAAIFSVVAPFYLPYLLTTDSFTLSMFLGALFFLALIKLDKAIITVWSYLSMGLIAGLLFLTRAEGVIWIVLFLYLALNKTGKYHSNWQMGTREILVTLMGFFLISSPWLWRNFQAFGRPFAPGNIRSIWLSNYDDLFAYPVQSLNMSNWLSNGIGPIVETALWAIGQNAIGSVVILGSILLFPMLMLGIWKNRHLAATRMSVLAWTASMILMSLFFPFQGVRGGFFHAGAALQPMFWALSAIGLNDLIRWAQEKRAWQAKQSQLILGGGLILILSIVSAGVFTARVIGDATERPIWNQSAQHYAMIAEYLSLAETLNEQPILVNNPPGWALQSKFPAIVIANENEQGLLDLANQFDASIVILEENHPAMLETLYRDPQGNPNFQWLITIDGSHILLIQRD